MLQGEISDLTEINEGFIYFLPLEPSHFKVLGLKAAGQVTDVLVMFELISQSSYMVHKVSMSFVCASMIQIQSEKLGSGFNSNTF